MKQDLLFVTMHKNILSKKEFKEKIAQLQKFAMMREDEYDEDNGAYQRLKAELERYLIFVEEKKPKQDAGGPQTLLGSRSISALGPSQSAIQLHQQQ